jgi:hypothetical protein
MPFLGQLLGILSLAHARAKELHEGVVDPHVDAHPNGMTAWEPAVLAERGEESHGLDRLDSSHGVEQSSDG